MIARNGAVIRGSMNMARASIITCAVAGLSLSITPITAHPVAAGAGSLTSIMPESRGDQKWLHPPGSSFSWRPTHT